MINFGELLNQFEDESPIFPKEIFESNIRHDRFEYLRGDQEKILEQWFSKKDEKNTIIKMNTGGGKTTVGLLQLQSSLNEEKGPALFLCLNNQLIKQVLKDAKDLGIDCVEINKDNSFPKEFLNGEAILVANFKRLFNARSIFGVQGDTSKEVIEVGAVVIDDAHAALAQAREAFTLKFTVKDKQYSELINIFKDTLIKQAVGSAEDIMSGRDRYGIMMVPYWSWIDKISDVNRLLSNYEDEDSELKFKWTLIRDYLEYCFVLVSATHIEIVPKCLPIHMIPTYSRAQRRIFMSATLNDDSALIKDFNINPEAILKPIQSETFSDVGEKLILAPFNIDKRLKTKVWAEQLKKITAFNIVTLVSADFQSELWIKAGFSKPDSDNINEKMENLHNSVNNHVVLSNRYDGIDLADNACRILVIDGMPIAHSLLERFNIFARPTSKLMQLNQAQKIEQGLGRAVRSVNDYAIIFLMGTNLVSKVSTKKFQEFMSPQTINQINLGSKIVDLIKKSGEDSGKAIASAMMQILKRDPQWVQLHKKQINKAVKASINKELVEAAKLEREAFDHALSRQYLKASETIRTKLRNLSNNDESEEGWYLQLAASYLYRIDRTQAMELQLAAHSRNPTLLKPLTGINYKKLTTKMTMQAQKIKEFLSTFNEPNAIILHISSILENLVFEQDSSTLFEKAFSDLGNILGYEAQQPETDYSVGPDILWNVYDDEYLVIEAKNEVKLDRKSIYKSETEQISEAMNWFNEEYSSDKKATPILVHPVTKLHKEAYGPTDLVILDVKGLEVLKKNVESFFANLATKPLDQWNVRDLILEINNYQLDKKNIKKYFSQTQN
ncbi:DEAD/DEAH box helicase family protein [Bacillus mycoides]|uniref:DEAD/DEAH box helicase n=1 Tax=Bacillus mycoides TaxID=1405 RepID=UPI001C013371|nr:DEAD/DEAH box helicase family protein [Bacillus mycoides]QWH38134.1 DEAD/DEAH box helicase family protein [Bacillus mycoides]